MNINCLSYIRMWLLKAKGSLWCFHLNPLFSYEDTAGLSVSYNCLLLVEEHCLTLSSIPATISNTFKISVWPLPLPQLLLLYWPGVSDLTWLPRLPPMFALHIPKLAQMLQSASRSQLALAITYSLFLNILNISFPCQLPSLEPTKVTISNSLLK